MEQSPNKIDVNQEPFPSFDIEINKEDKDSDIEKPNTHKDPEKDDNSEVPDQEKG